MAEELLESEAVEEAAADDETPAEARPLPARPSPQELGAWRGEVRTAALAAAGGLVAGAATVAAVRATRGTPVRRRSKPPRKAQSRPANVIASRSFLVDVHLLGDR